MVAGRRCPLAPRLYRQQAVCTAAGVPFRSKIDLMTGTISAFAPLPDTQTHVLVDSWYGAKAVWRAARARGFLITSGHKSNRSLRVPDAGHPRGWRWQRLGEYAAGPTDAAYTAVTWPTQEGGRTVYAHVVQTRVRKLYRCQVVIVREALDAPLSQARYWASTDLTADLPALVGHLAARWQGEVPFADAKDVLGLDHLSGVKGKGSPAKLVLRLNIAWKVGRANQKWPRISAAEPASGRFRGCRPYRGT